MLKNRLDCCAKDISDLKADKFIAESELLEAKTKLSFLPQKIQKSLEQKYQQYQQRKNSRLKL